MAVALTSTKYFDKTNKTQSKCKWYHHADKISQKKTKYPSMILSEKSIKLYWVLQNNKK
jgi:hypothetical protein